MSLKINLLFLIAIYSSSLSCQDYFFKTWSSEFTATGQQINEFNGKFYLSSAKICNNIRECAFFSEIDLLGNELSRKDLDFIDITHRTTFIEDDTVYIAGNDDFSQSKFILHKMSINGDSITTIDIVSDEAPYTNMFLIAAQKYNDQIILAGTGALGEDNFSLVFVVDLDGTVQKTITPTVNTFRSTIWDMKIDDDNNLVLFLNRQNNFEDEFRQIIKYDENYDRIWSYSTEKSENDDTVTKGCILNDGRIGFVTKHTERRMDAIRAINQDSTVSWHYDWPNETYIDIKIHRLEILHNGDILGMGSSTDKSNEPRIEGAPFIFRMSPDGELLWERIFVEVDPSDGESKRGTVWDLQELDNGDLVGTGYLRHETQDVLLFRTDANGCIHEEDCDDINIITAAEEILNDTDGIKIFPLPAQENRVLVQIDATIISSELKLQGYDLQGRKLALTIEEVNAQEYVISNLPKGVVILELVDQEGKRIVEKIINL